MCERATGLISLFIAGCLTDPLVRRLSPLTGSTVSKVSSPGWLHVKRGTWNGMERGTDVKCCNESNKHVNWSWRELI